MTIEANSDEIWLRCASGDDTMISIEAEGENLRINAYPEPGDRFCDLASQLSPDEAIPVSALLISTAEAVMLAHGLLELVKRAQGETHPQGAYDI